MVDQAAPKHAHFQNQDSGPEQQSRAHTFPITNHDQSSQHAHTAPSPPSQNTQPTQSSPPPQSRPIPAPLQPVPTQFIGRTRTFIARHRRTHTDTTQAPVEQRYTHDYLFCRPRPLQLEQDGYLVKMDGNLQFDASMGAAAHQREQDATLTAPVMPVRSEDSDSSAGTQRHNEAASSTDKVDPSSLANSFPGPTRTNTGQKTHKIDTLHAQRARTDLLVDLLWVGIISNISATYFETTFTGLLSVSDALGNFVLIFIPAYRIWFMLQRFLNAYFSDDLPQRILVVWIMVLGLIWGTNAPYFLIDQAPEGSTPEEVEQTETTKALEQHWLIITYLVARITMFAYEIVYCIWIPWLRRSVLRGCIIAIPGTVLWILTGVLTDPDTRVSLLIAAIVVDTVEGAVLGLPIADRMLGNGIRIAMDTRHMISRYESFFLITLGEGVFLLVRSSPGGAGFHYGLAAAAQGLIIYYFLGWIYYTGNLSRRFIHAFNRRWWIRLLWQLVHMPLFGALILLSSGILYLVQYTVWYAGDETTGHTSSEATTSASHLFSRGGRAAATTASSSSTSEVLSKLTRRAQEEATYDDSTLQLAIVTVCACVAITLLCTLVLSILHRPLDPPRTLWIQSSWVRMIPRLAACLVMALIWLYDFTDPVEVLGAVTATLFGTMILEKLMGMGRQSRLIEPKEKAALQGVAGAL